MGDQTSELDSFYWSRTVVYAYVYLHLSLAAFVPHEINHIDIACKWEREREGGERERER